MAILSVLIGMFTLHLVQILPLKSVLMHVKDKEILDKVAMCRTACGLEHSQEHDINSQMYA